MWVRFLGRNMRYWTVQLFLCLLLIWLLIHLMDFSGNKKSADEDNWIFRWQKHISDKSSHDFEAPFFLPRHKYDCNRLISGLEPEPNSLQRALAKDNDLRTIFSDCKQLYKFHYYPAKPLSAEESEFPLAYVILVNEHLEQVEILLNSIYQPQNSYCLHVDLKSDLIFYDSLQKLSRCFKNVFLVDDIVNVSPVSNSMIQAQVKCLKMLTRKELEWKYVMVLQGHDFPIKSNREIVNILKIHDGANDVELIRSPIDRWQKKWLPVTDNRGLVVDMSDQVGAPHNDPPPAGMEIFKGSIAVSINRKVADFVANSEISRRFIDWLNTSYMPDELFWSTLNHNELLGLEGQYPGDCLNDRTGGGGMKTWVSRFAIWDGYNHLKCHGAKRHSVCLFSMQDLKTVFNRPELFANKIWMPSDPVVLDCAHEVIFNKTFTTDQSMDWLQETPPTYYQNLSAVVYHKWKKEQEEKRLNFTGHECALCYRDCQH